MTYRFDAELAPWVSMMPQLDIRDIAAARAELAAMMAAMPSAEPIGDLTVSDRTIPGPDGAPDVLIRIYTPRGRDTILPAMLFIHSGGFVVGSVEQEDAGARAFADGADTVIVSVDYRLAPEHPYPAGLQDCFAALTWLADNAAELGVDPARIGVGGASAGGGLAAAIALMARDRGGPSLCLQYLAIPELDDRLATPSMTAYVDTPVWHRRNAELSWQMYLNGAEADQYAAPSRAIDLSGLPPAYISVCQFDPLRDEGIDYAQRLAQTGTPTELHLFPGTFHGSSLIADAQVSQRMATQSIAAVRALLHP